MRILANRDNVEQLFKPSPVPYTYQDDNGVKHELEIPGWECRSCGWKSLKGVYDLPFPHECNPLETGTASVDQTFTVK